MTGNLRTAYCFSYQERIPHCSLFFDHKNYNSIGTTIIVTPLNSIANAIKRFLVIDPIYDLLKTSGL